MAFMSRVLQGVLLAVVVAFLTAGLAAQQRPSNNGKSNLAPGRIAQAQTKQITEEQKAGVRDRVALATRIIEKHKAEAEALGLAPDWRRAQFERLLPLSIDSLQAVESAGSLDALSLAVTAELADPQVIGSNSDDLVYRPITPCRYIDTRNAGGRINGYRGYDLASNGAAYGGAAACDPEVLFDQLENYIGAVVMNATIVSPTAAPGFLAIKPTQAAPLTSLLNWYQAGASVQMANQGIVTPDHGGAAEEFWIQTSAPTHVIIDLFGAFIAPEATALQTSFVTTITTNVGANGSLTLPIAVCPAGYAITGGGIDSDSWALVVVESRQADAPYQNGWRCSVHNASAAIGSARCTATCNRIPGR